MSEVILDYYDESKKGEELFFSDAPKKKNLNDKSRFFRVIEEPNKIIKYSITGLDVDKTIEMQLAGVTNNLGRKLLYRGLYPNE